MDLPPVTCQIRAMHRESARAPQAGRVSEPPFPSVRTKDGKVVPLQHVADEGVQAAASDVDGGSAGSTPALGASSTSVAVDMGSIA